MPAHTYIRRGARPGRGGLWPQRRRLPSDLRAVCRRPRVRGLACLLLLLTNAAAHTNEMDGAIDLPPSIHSQHRYPKQNSCQAFVVNNYVGTGGLDEDAYCTLAPTPELKQGLAAFCNVRLSSLWPEAARSKKEGRSLALDVRMIRQPPHPMTGAATRVHRQGLPRRLRLRRLRRRHVRARARQRRVRLRRAAALGPRRRVLRDVHPPDRGGAGGGPELHHLLRRCVAWRGVSSGPPPVDRTMLV